MLAGIRGRLDDTILGQRIRLAAALVFVAIPTLLLALLLTRETDPSILNTFFPILAALLAILAFSAILNLIGGGIDGIYEKGVTSGSSTVLDRIRGYHFQSFAEITKVGLGFLELEGERVRFLALYGTHGQKLRPFIDFGYKNDFFESLMSTLRERCPSTKWEEVECEELERR